MPDLIKTNAVSHCNFHEHMDSTRLLFSVYWLPSNDLSFWLTGLWTFPYWLKKRLGYVCNPRSLKEGTETSRRRTDELGSRLERPIHFECKLNEPMHIGMRLLHPAAADHSVSINRQQVQRIFRFSLRSRAGARPLSGGTGAVATGRDVSVPSFRERGLHT